MIVTLYKLRSLFSVCHEAAEWLTKEWPGGIDIAEFWEQCNVPTWMMYALDCLAWEARLASEGWYASMRVRDDLTDLLADAGCLDDSQPRPDLADALREIFPVEFVLQVARDALGGVK